MIRVAAYRGTSLVSWAIKRQTRSKYSHVAALLDDDSVVEAWHRGGVSHVDGLWINHDKSTKIDVFRVSSTLDQEALYEQFLLDQVGKKYDFKSVLRFVSHSHAKDNNKWFCSELICAALNHAGINVLRRIVPAEVSPQLLVISPMLKDDRF